MRAQLYKFKNRPKKQKGIVLIVGLVMVLLISINALSSISGSGLQEAMVGNMRDRGLSFQASEAALSVGESTLKIGTPPNCDGASNNGFICFLDFDSNQPSVSLQYAPIATFDAKGNTTSLSLSGIASQPRYVVEQLADYQVKDDGSALEYNGMPANQIRPYRITAIGVGASTDTQVIVQSIYAIPRNN